MSVNENEKQYNAFRTYLSLYLERQRDPHSTSSTYGLYDEVAEIVGVSNRTVRRWSSDFQWKKRVLEESKKLNDELLEKMRHRYVHDQFEAIKIYDLLITTFVEELLRNDTYLRILSMKDLVLILNARLNMNPASDSKNEDNNSVVVGLEELGKIQLKLLKELDYK